MPYIFLGERILVPAMMRVFCVCAFINMTQKLHAFPMLLCREVTPELLAFFRVNTNMSSRLVN
jgi:hypothetical protein